MNFKLFSTIFLAAITTLTLSPVVFAHGEDTEGPHGGHIRMPGAFHTELSLGKKQDLHIYLLDMNFQNPTVKDSSVSVQALDGKTKVSFKCSVMGGNHFHCLSETSYSPKSKIILTATREKAQGNEAVYQLPLPKLKKSSVEKNDSHHNH